MQKKILLSLLVASPTAVPALANIDYGHGNWEPSGMSGSDQVNIDNEKGDVSCLLGSGTTKWVVKNMMPGKYQLSFATMSDNLSVVVEQGGKELTLTKESNTFGFEITEGNEVTISVKGTTPSPYSFTGAQLQLIFDFPATGDALQKLLDEVADFSTIEDENFEGAKDLLTEKTALEKEAEGYQGIIDQLKDSETTSETLEKLYNEEGLYNDPSDIAKNIKAYGESVEAWNAKVAKLNKAIENTITNTKEKNTLLEEQSTLIKNIEELIEKIESGSEYGKQTDLQAAQNLLTEIENYAEEIKSAYADDKLSDEIKFESRNEALQAGIDSLEAKWNADEADWTAYQKFMNTVYPGLQNAVDDATEAINALQGVKGHELVFADKKTEAVEEVTKIFTEAKEDLTITSIAGANEKLSGDEATVAEAITAIKETVENITNLVESQNSNYSTAAERINNFNSEFEEYKQENVPDSLKEDYDSKVEEIQGLINTLQDYVVGQYEGATLEVTTGTEVGEEYLAQVEAIEEALSELQTLVAPIEEINELKTDFDDAKEYIKGLSDELGTDSINLYGLFNKEEGTFSSIDESINKLTNPSETDINNIKDAIKDAKSTADKLYDVFNLLKGADAQYLTDANDLKKFVEEKIEIDDTGKAVSVLKTTFMTKGEGGTFLANQQKFNSDFKNLAESGNPQTIYNDATALCKANIETTGEGEDRKVTYLWEAGLEEIMQKFAKDVTDSNKANLDTIIEDAKESVEKLGEFAGSDTIDFTEIDNKAAEIQTAIDAAASEENPVEAYGEADEDIVKLIPGINTLIKKAEEYAQNQKDYDELLGMLTGKEGLQIEIDKLTIQNDQESEDQGKEYFTGVISTNDDSLQAQLDAINTNLDEALQEYDDSEKNVTGNKTAIKGQIDALKEKIVKTATDITNNNLAHTQQLNMAEQVSEYIATALETLENYYNNQEGVEEWYEETKEKITGLRDTDLFNNNVAVANAYGEGKSYSDDAKLTGEYERIYNEVETLVNGMMSDYEQAVIAANNTIVTDAGWAAKKAEMNSEYVAAITTFNSYYYGLTNPGWKAAVLETVARHEEIYQYSQKINQLVADVNAWIKDHNDAPVTFTADDFEKIANDKANELIEEMQEKVNTLNTEIAALANKYYTEKHDEAETQINGYQSQLDTAGIEGDYLTEVKAYLTNAENQYATAVENTDKEPLGLAMDRIADQLDDALQPVNLQTIVENAWEDAYSGASKTAEDILTGLNDNSDDYKFADPELIEQAIEDVSGNIEKMKELNKEVSNVTEDLIDDYAGYKQQLDDLLDSINASREEVKKDSSNNKDSQDLYNTLTGTTIPDLESAFKALVDYASSLAGGQQYDSTEIGDMIDDLKSFVEENSGTLASEKDIINSIVKTIEESIENGYPTIAGDEYNYLTKVLLDKVKVAFNDAKAAFNGSEGTESNLDKETGEDTINGWNNDIDNLEKEVKALNELLNPTDFDSEEFKDAALKLEAALSDIYVGMEQTWTGAGHDGSNPAADVKASLEEKYNEIKEAIANAEEYLNGCEEGLDTSEYKDALDAATTALDAEKADWESVGNRVVPMEKTYEAALEEIAGNVEDTLSAAKAANEKAIEKAEAKKANDTAYATLSEELEGLKAELARVAGLAHEWYGEDYDGTIDSIERYIERSEEDLEARNEEVSLTSDSVLSYKSTITTRIINLEYSITYRQAGDWKTVAGSALNEVGVSLRGNLVPEVRAELEEQYGELQEDFVETKEKQNDTSDLTTSERIELLNEVITEYQDITDKANELNATVEENSFVLGDVDLNPDGLVTSADVQQLIRWILDGMTWQELYEENPRQACAADISGDESLNITDVTMDIDLMYGESVNTRRLARFAAPAIDKNVNLTVQLVSEENGVRRYAVVLDSSATMIAGQFDLKLSSNMSIRDIVLADRTGNHMIESKEHGFDKLRVVLYSMENAAIEDNSGAIFYVDVEGNGELRAEGAIMTDNYFNTYEIANGQTSFIDSIMETAKDYTKRFYNAAGMMFNKLQNGINIYRGEDGKMKKIFNRKK